MPPWFLWTLLALFSWGVWAILSKLIGDALSATHSQALSTIGLLPVMLALALCRKGPTTGSKRQGILCALAAGLLACVGNAAYYYVLSRGGKAATVVPLTALYPLVTVVLAVLLLREKLNRIQLGGMLLSLSAIYLFNVQREAGLFSTSLAWVAATIALWGVSGFLQKLSTNEISGEVAAFWFMATFIPVAAIIIWCDPIRAGLAGKTWMLVILLGLFFALGNFALLAAFARQGKASIIAPLTGLYPVVSVPIAILFLQEKVAVREAIAIVLTLVSVAALSYEPPPRTVIISNSKSSAQS